MEKLIAMQPNSAEMLKSSRDGLLTVLIAVQVAFLGLVFVVSIFLSHKTAGPMYKLSQYLERVRQGKEKNPLYFRNGDNFQEIATDINETIGYFKDQHNEDFEYLSEVSAYIQNISLVVPEDKKPVLLEIQSKLLEIQSRYTED